MFMEEAEPLPLAAYFILRDYDSPDSPTTPPTITLTLTEAVDEESEGIRVVTSGGVIMEEADPIELYTKVYTLTNGTSYSQYQQVCCEVVPLSLVM